MIEKTHSFPRWFIVKELEMERKYMSWSEKRKRKKEFLEATSRHNEALNKFSKAVQDYM